MIGERLLPATGSDRAEVWTMGVPGEIENGAFSKQTRVSCRFTQPLAT